MDDVSRSDRLHHVLQAMASLAAGVSTSEDVKDMTNDNAPTASPQAPTVIVKAGNPLLTIVLSLLVGLAAFLGGVQLERNGRSDYTVRVVGVPERINVVGAPNSIAVSGIPERIEVAGGVQGIPDSITFKGASLEGILPKGVDVRTAATATIDNRHVLAVTPQGTVYMVYFEETVPELGTGIGTWKVWKAAGP